MSFEISDTQFFHRDILCKTTTCYCITSDIPQHVQRLFLLLFFFFLNQSWRASCNVLITSLFKGSHLSCLTQSNGILVRLLYLYGPFVEVWTLPSTPRHKTNKRIESIYKAGIDTLWMKFAAVWLKSESVRQQIKHRNRRISDHIIETDEYHIRIFITVFFMYTSGRQWVISCSRSHNWLSFSTVHKSQSAFL